MGNTFYERKAVIDKTQQQKSQRRQHHRTFAVGKPWPAEEKTFSFSALVRAGALSGLAVGAEGAIQAHGWPICRVYMACLASSSSIPK